ncbi:hypothetical protein FYJ92_14960 [Pseudarthrobacter sp. NBSH8]|nr:hypothetical protein FYJ92_14960 [Pseudarthrobacter sp. NBSH8]
MAFSTYSSTFGLSARTRAGLPPASDHSGISLATTDPAATTDPTPTDLPGMISVRALIQQ